MSSAEIAERGRWRFFIGFIAIWKPGAFIRSNGHLSEYGFFLMVAILLLPNMATYAIING